MIINKELTVLGLLNVGLSGLVTFLFFPEICLLSIQYSFLGLFFTMECYDYDTRKKQLKERQNQGVSNF